VDCPHPDRALPESGALRHGAQRGQVLALAAVVAAFLFVPLTVFLIDTALVEAAYVQLGETVQAAAEDGASSLDEARFRQSGGVDVVLDQPQAQRVADQAMHVSSLSGLQGWTISTSSTAVTVAAEQRVRLLVAGSTTIRQRRSASFVYAP
jgi:hypothetical protein